MRQCSRFDDMQQWATKFNLTKPVQDARLTNIGSSQPTRITQPRPPNVCYCSSFFKNDASIKIFDMACPSESVEDPAMPSLESTPGNPRTILFFVCGIVHNQILWVLAKSGSVKNLIDDDVFSFLPFEPPLNQRNIPVYGGNGGPLDVR